ncbi:MAG: ribosome hibernation-promoting factor, HPF/YfiA family [Phycisphaerales bacterium JB043]
MRIEVTGKGVKLTDPITSYAEKKCDKITKYYDGVQEIEVILDQANHKHTTKFLVEILVHAVGHDPFVARSEDNDIYAALDLASDRISRQLRDYKEKIRDH